MHEHLSLVVHSHVLRVGYVLEDLVSVYQIGVLFDLSFQTSSLRIIHELRGIYSSYIVADRLRACFFT